MTTNKPVESQSRYQVITYDAKYKDVFRLLNLQWIEKHFHVEKKDLEQVNHPEAILTSGGQIFFVMEGERALGTCAVYPVKPGSYEIAKMAVNPEARGRGLGDMLMVAAESWIRSQKGTEIILLSNTVLSPAISLYQKHGYEITHLGPHPDYERCNIELKKRL